MSVVGLAACGSTSGGTAAVASHPAAAGSTAPPTALSTPDAASPLATSTALPTTAATASAAGSALLRPPTPGTATVATLWCGGAVTGAIYAPTLSVWKTGAYGYNNAYAVTVPNIKATVVAIEKPDTAAAAENAMALTLCEEVGSADQEPPPVDAATWSAAMADFYAASKIMRTNNGGYSAGGAAQPGLAAGLAKIHAVLTRIGKEGT